MYSQSVRGPDGAGVGSILSRGDAGLHQNAARRTAGPGRAWNAVSLRPVALASTQQVVHLWALRRSTPERRRGGGLKAVSHRGPEQTLPARLKVRAGAAEGWLPLSLKCFRFSRQSLQFHSFVQVLKRNYEVTVKEAGSWSGWT